MSRSNSNPDRTGVPASRTARGPDAVDHGLPWADGGQGAGYEAQHGGQPGQLPWPHQPQTLPPQAPPLQQYQGQQGYAPSGYAPPNYPQPQQYAPQPDPHHGHYFPPAAAPQPGDYQQQPAYAQAGYQPPQGYPDPAQQLRGSYAEQGYAPPPPPAGYPAAPAYGQPQGVDPRGYDLGAYGAPQQGGVDPVTGRPTAPSPASGALGVRQPVAAPHAQHDETDDDEYEDDDEEEVPRRRFGILKIMGALVLAVAIGGGAAYGLKKFGGGLMTAATKPVVVKADAGPARTRPAGPTVAAVDTKAVERLSGEAIPQVVPADAGGDQAAPAAARKVQTIEIPTATAPPLRQTISVPGLTIAGLPPQQPQAAAPQPAPQAAALPPITPAPPGRAVAPPPAAAAAAPRAPIVPKVIAAVDDPAAAKAAVAPRAAVAKAAKVAKANDAYSPGGGAAPAATVAAATVAPAVAARPAGGNGYIAVLASQGTAIDARKTLDDLQGRYSDVLAGKATDVTEFANPRDGKTYYRAVVGPPGSREAAAQVCTQLKAAGHKDCFATAY